MASAEEPVRAVPSGNDGGDSPHGTGEAAGPPGRDPAAAERAASHLLVATAPRWAAGSAAFALGLAVAAEGALRLAHSGRPFETLAAPLVLAATAASLVLLFLLRAEESRLSLELRTARTGTRALRSLVARRRVALPIFARLATTTLGTAAVLIADGDREGALDRMAKTTALMRGGRLDALRAIVEADLRRADGTTAGLARCVSELRAMPPIDNREADLYRLHVLVKAILARGDGQAAFELATELASAVDDEARIYATWLRVWFELDLEASADDAAAATGAADADGDANADRGEPWPALSDGDLRMAALLARAHGAEDLVTKLSQRLSGIAPSGPRE
jgi:hypothetical protein